MAKRILQRKVALRQRIKISGVKNPLGELDLRIVSISSLRGTSCDICHQTMTVIDGKLRCMFCEEFYLYDMSRAWIDFSLQKKSSKSEKNRNSTSNSAKKNDVES